MHRRRRTSDARELVVVAGAPVVFSPIHVGCIGCEIGSGDVAVRADLGVAETREEPFRHIRAVLAVAVGEAVIDALPKA